MNKTKELIIAILISLVIEIFLSLAIYIHTIREITQVKDSVIEHLDLQVSKFNNFTDKQSIDLDSAKIDIRNKFNKILK